MAFDQLSMARNPEMTIGQKFWQMTWGLVLVIVLLAGIGVAMLYSAANGDLEPWASRQLLRFGACLGLMFVVAVIDIRFWFRAAYLIFLACLALLVAVEFKGSIGMGAQRWIDLGFMQLQPSELMKISVVLVLARHFHGIGQEEIGSPVRLVLPFMMVAVPVALVLKQPDLGTAAMLLMVGGALFFASGVRLWKFAAVSAAGVGAVPVAWQFLHDYQRQRVLTFLDPEQDPLGSGYHILQSKIALGSGGMWGKGFLGGTQSHLNFLPEKQTDFIFTMLAEEFGMVGGLVMLGLFALVLVYAFAIALRSRNQFGRLLAVGIGTNLFLYVFINIAMVMGVIPVVGVPLPLVSYGGTAMMAIMVGFGLLMSVYVHRDVRISKRGLNED